MSRGVVVGAGSPDDRLSIPLSTRMGTPILNERRGELVPEAKAASVREWKEKFPNNDLKSIESIYNCMGMLFACRRTAVDIDDLEVILREDGYRLINPPPDAEVGDVVVYKDRNQATHVGMLYRVELLPTLGEYRVEVLSKWGFVGEYVHRLQDVPAVYGEPAEYWTHRLIDIDT